MRHTQNVLLALLAILPLGCGTATVAPQDPQRRFVPTIAPFVDGAPVGNDSGSCRVPEAALPDPMSEPDQVVGTGTPGSCTADALRSAWEKGGRIAFDCGPDTHRILLDRPLALRNDVKSPVVLDGGGKIALSGGGKSRIIYMNTCDQNLKWTTSHCQDQDHPRLKVQNLSFIDGNSESETQYDGGGAIWARGGTLAIVHCRFENNHGAKSGPDVGGGAVRAFSQSGNAPLQVANSTFVDNVASNGGALSSIGVDWEIWNSVFRGNAAVGSGGNPSRSGTVGGGSGGAIYNDGNSLTLSVCGSILEANRINDFGPAIFFVANDHNGLLRLEDTRISGNTGGGGVWQVLPGISMHADTRREIVNSTLED
ncbi:MAG: hypothetical protein H6686_05865 [Fibrobacteria bacterium]|nr:hypothetical protein [Fibrobacteria bacterium]